MSRHQRLGKTMNSEQRRMRRLRNRAMRQWKRSRALHIMQWADKDGDAITGAVAREQANVVAEVWFGHSGKAVFTGKRAEG
jgi:hypothetical protein